MQSVCLLAVLSVGGIHHAASFALSPSPLYVRPCHSARTSARLGLHASAAAAPALAAPELKSKILQIAALSDRGQRLNTLVAPVYQELRSNMKEAADKLCEMSEPIDETSLAGEWELVYSDVELFRSSPFFLAIEQALDTSPGIPTLGKWLGITDPTKKSAMFFKLHQLQVLSWGASTVGRISQTLDFEKKELTSSFDTILFGLTVIPILGWFKLLPTFGGRVVTLADKMELKGNEVHMELAKTQVIDAPGVDRIPFVSGFLMDRWYPVNSVWKLLPWNGGPFDGRAPVCKVTVVYVDDNMRITKVRLMIPLPWCLCHYACVRMFVCVRAKTPSAGQALHVWLGCRCASCRRVAVWTRGLAAM